MKKILPIILCILLCSYSCTTVKRYKSATAKETAKDDTLVEIDLFSTKLETEKTPTPPKTLWDLQPEGQAEYIKQSTSRYADEEKYIAYLNNLYIKPKEIQNTDFTSKDLKLVFSISKKRKYNKIGKLNTTFNIADRIEYIKYDITIPDSLNVNFVKWNKYETEYSSIDIADVTFNQSLDVTAGTDLTNSFTKQKTDGIKTTTNANSVTPSVSATGKISTAEVQKVKFRYLAVNGKIADKKIEIEQEGMREIDLTGNVIADLNLKFDEFPQLITTIEGLKAADGTYNTPDKLKITKYMVKVPYLLQIPETIKAKLTYEYAYRHVVKGEETFFEWDDVVEYRTGKHTKEITLFKKKDIVPKFYVIANADKTTKIFIKDNATGDITELLFGTLNEAQQFYSWLLSHTPSSGSTKASTIKNNRYSFVIRSQNPDQDLTLKLLESGILGLNPLDYY